MAANTRPSLQALDSTSTINVPERVAKSKFNGEVIIGDTEYDGRAILYILKADQTNYINYIKPLILAEELQLPHLLSVIDARDEWFYRIHPERMVPALKDHDPETNQQVVVFEGTACLQYLAERYDVDGTWRGRNLAEKGAILAWTVYQTAGLGMHSNTLKHWDILEKRVGESGQDYIALGDRPTLTDLSYFPFAMPWMFTFLGVDIKDWPHIQKWSKRMLSRPPVSKVLGKAPTLGH
ncbi:hypothetical protein DL769_000247 [Monosporascus sp. CRB-8-3]|nr:hypothetical protein DL769_000247 [Monosporascus sp. CRB-8-3]